MALISLTFFPVHVTGRAGGKPGVGSTSSPPRALGVRATLSPRCRGAWGLVRRGPRPLRHVPRHLCSTSGAGKGWARLPTVFPRLKMRKRSCQCGDLGH